MLNARFHDAWDYYMQQACPQSNEAGLNLFALLNRAAYSRTPLTVDLNVQAAIIIMEQHHQFSISDVSQYLIDKVKSERTYVIDAWGLYLLAVNDRLDELSASETVYVTHHTVIRLIHACLRGQDDHIRTILFLIESCENIHVQSPKLTNIGTARTDDNRWSEPMMAVILANELKCPCYLGDIEERARTDVYQHLIVRYGWI